MASKYEEFTEKVESNLKSNLNATRFYINFKYNNKQHRRFLDYTEKDWDKRTRVSKAKLELTAI